MPKTSKPMNTIRGDQIDDPGTIDEDDVERLERELEGEESPSTEVVSKDDPEAPDMDNGNIVDLGTVNRVIKMATEGIDKDGKHVSVEDIEDVDEHEEDVESAADPSAAFVPVDKSTLISDADAEIKKRKPGRPAGTTTRKKEQAESLIPDVSKLRIWKRYELGRMKFIGEYGADELKDCGSVEVFIKKYIVPTYKDGDFIVATVNKKGEVTARTTVSTEGPMEQSQDKFDPGKLLNMLADTNTKMRKEVEEAETKRRDELFKVAQLLATKTGTSDNTMLMMMIMNQMQARPQAEPGSSALIDAMKGLIDKVSKDKEPVRPSVIDLPPLLPMSQDSGLGSAETIKAIAEALKPQQPPMSVTDLVTLAKALQPDPALQKPSFSIQDAIALLPTVLPVIKSALGIDKLESIEKKLEEAEKAPRRDIQTIVAEFKALQSMSQMFNPQPAFDNFWSFAHSFLEKIPEEAVGNFVASLRSGSDQKQLTNGQSQSAEPGGDYKLTLPEGYESHAETITNAKDELALIEASLKFLRFLAKDKNWMKFIFNGVQRAKSGDKESVMEFITKFFEGMHEGDVISKEISDKGIIAFRNHLDQVIKFVSGWGAKAQAA